MKDDGVRIERHASCGLGETDCSEAKFAPAALFGRLSTTSLGKHTEGLLRKVKERSGAAEARWQTVRSERRRRPLEVGGKSKVDFLLGDHAVRAHP